MVAFVCLFRGVSAVVVADVVFVDTLNSGVTVVNGGHLVVAGFFLLFQHTSLAFPKSLPSVSRHTCQLISKPTVGIHAN